MFGPEAAMLDVQFVLGGSLDRCGVGPREKMSDVEFDRWPCLFWSSS